MSWYGPEQVQRVREAAPLLTVAERYVEPRKAGGHYLACCCYHQERTPSFHIYDDHFHCFGCGAHGDAITLVQDREGLTFQDAVAWLAREFKIVLEDRSHQRGNQDALRPLLGASELASAFYEQSLWLPTGADALAYLRGRGLTDESIRRWRLGWAGGGLVDTALGEGATVDCLVTADLAADHEGRIRDRFWRRITVPIVDASGQVIGFTARALPADEALAKANNRFLPKYINSKDTPIYHKGDVVFGLRRARGAARAAKRLLLVEGALDVIACDQAGLAETVACLGTAMTEAQANLLSLAVPRSSPVVVALDGDRAGRTARLKAVRLLVGAGASVQVASLPDGDPAELLIEQGEDGDRNPAAFKDALKDARPGVEFLLGELAPDPDGLDEGQRLAVLDDLILLVATAVDPAYRSLVLGHAAKHLGIDRALVKRRAKSSAPSSENGPSLPRIECTDYGNSQRFLAKTRGEVLYCVEWKSWVVWDGQVWRIDDRAAWRRYHEAVWLHLAEEIADARRQSNSDWLGELLAWRRACGSANSHKSGLECAGNLADWQAKASDFNLGPELLSVSNGTVDLANGKVSPHAKEHHITRQGEALAGTPEPELAARWASFVLALCGSPEVARFLQRFVGYSATAHVREKAIVILQGDGDTGKTTFTNAVRAVLGTYAGILNAENFLQQQLPQKKWELANADSARFVPIEEVGTEGRHFAIDFLKSATGGNPMTGERKSQQPYSFTPVWKLLFVCNDVPGAPAGDNATWNRIHLIRAAAPPKVKDKSLKDLFDSPAGRTAILAWIIDGARDYLQRGGLDAPEEVRLATRNHRNDCDTLGQYIEENWVFDQNTAPVPVREFMADLQAWCRAHGFKEPSAKGAIKRLGPWGVTPGAWHYDQENGKSHRAWLGLRRHRQGDERVSIVAGAPAQAVAPDSLHLVAPHSLQMPSPPLSGANSAVSGGMTTEQELIASQTCLSKDPPTVAPHPSGANLERPSGAFSTHENTTTYDNSLRFAPDQPSRVRTHASNPLDSLLNNPVERERNSSDLERASEVDPTEAEERAAIIAESAAPIPPPYTAPAAHLGPNFNTWPAALRERHSFVCEDLLRRLHGIVSNGKGGKTGPHGMSNVDLVQHQVELARSVAAWMRGLGKLPDILPPGQIPTAHGARSDIKKPH